MSLTSSNSQYSQCYNISHSLPLSCETQCGGISSLLNMKKLGKGIIPSKCMMNRKSFTNFEYSFHVCDFPEEYLRNDTNVGFQLKRYKCKYNVNEHVCSPNISVSSVSCTMYTADIGIHSFKIQRILCSLSQSPQLSIFHSTTYLLMLVGQRQHWGRSLPSTNIHVVSSWTWTPDLLILKSMPIPLAAWLIING